MRYTLLSLVLTLCLAACGESEEKREDSVLETTAKNTINKAEEAAAKVSRAIEEQQKVLDVQ